MAFIPVPNTVKVTLEWLIGGQIVAITLSFTRADAPTVANMNDLLTQLESWRATTLNPLIGTGAVAQRWVATDQTSASGPVVEKPITTSATGGMAGTNQANNVTVACTFITALRGRSYRGRVYEPALTSNQVLNSVAISASAATAITAAYALLNTALLSTGYAHSVASRYANNAPRVTGVATPVTAYRTEVNIDSQRRRLARRGL